MLNVAISYSKLRDDFGAVGGSVRNNKIYVNMARRWPAEKVTEMADSMLTYYNRIQWHETIIDQISGEYIISMLKNRSLPVKVISTSKNVRDADQIERIKVMDKIEMTEFLRKLKINRQLRVPMNPSKHMKDLEDQIPMYAKHTTEAGGIDYYAPGTEPDDLVRALLIMCFSLRNFIDHDQSIEHVLGGVPEPKSTNYELSNFEDIAQYL